MLEATCLFRNSADWRNNPGCTFPACPSARRPKFNTSAAQSIELQCARTRPGDSMCRYELLNTLIAYINNRFFNPPIHFDF